MNQQDRRVRAVAFVAPLLTAAVIGSAAALANSQLLFNGKVASSDVRVIDGSAYVKLADVARALDMVVVKRGNGYEMRKAGGANPIQGVTQGKIGDVLFDGKWRFQVLSLQTPDNYTMKTESDPYDFIGLTHLDRTTHIMTPKAGYKLVVLQCRVTNGRNSSQRLWTAISDDKMHTALADTQGGSHPPVAYDYEGGPNQTPPLLPGAITTFPVIFSVPQDTGLKDLVFTLRANGDETHNDVRVALAGAK